MKCPTETKKINLANVSGVERQKEAKGVKFVVTYHALLKIWRNLIKDTINPHKSIFVNNFVIIHY